MRKASGNARPGASFSRRPGKQQGGKGEGGARPALHAPSTTGLARTFENDDKRAKQLALDKDFGFEFLDAPRQGWLVNMVPSAAGKDVASSSASSSERAALDLFFVESQGTRFKATIMYEPYFYVLAKPDLHKEVKSALERRFGTELSKCEELLLDDLDMANHLSGIKCVAPPADGAGLTTRAGGRASSCRLPTCRT
jgi:hypothetical protein